MKHHIKWPNLTQTAYTYGSYIKFCDDQVLFDNPQMPPSFVIASWQSVVNFQSERRQLNLPLLKKGETYHLSLDAEVIPSNSLYVKISYFSRYNEQLFFEIIKGSQGEFTYPIEAFSYTIELINAGCERLLFRHLTLSDLNCQEELYLNKRRLISQNKVNRLVFLEPNTYQLSNVVQNHLNGIDRLAVVPVGTNSEDDYCTESFEDYLKQLLARKDTIPKTIDFIGYGPIGNFFSVYYALRFGGRAFITDIFAENRVYHKWLKGNRKQVEQVILSILAEKKKGIRYGQKDLVINDSLVSNFIDYSYQLTYLEMDMDL